MSYEAERQAAPKETVDVRGDPEQGVTELTGTLFSPHYIYDWRSSRFIEAAKAALQTAGKTSIDRNEAIILRTGCFSAASRAGIYEPGEGVVKFSEPVQRLGRLLGPEIFQSIYNAPPPKELIDYILSGRPAEEVAKALGTDEVPTLKHVVPLGQITVEVLRGRLQWEERFAEAGVPTPEEYVARAPSCQYPDGRRMWGTY